MNVKYPHFSRKILNIHSSSYQNPKTSAMSFGFLKQIDLECLAQKDKWQVIAYALESKALFVLDHLFSDEELKSLEEFSKNSSYSRSSYGSQEAIDQGEKPARSMNGKERWDAFFFPKAPMVSFYKWIETLSSILDVDIYTIPWELSDGKSSSPATIANWVEEVTETSTILGKHQDYNPQGGLPFSIPCYEGSQDLSFERFENGAIGKPYILSIMIYATADNFSHTYGMGTRFFNNDGDKFIDVDCAHGRVVVFEGDIWHSLAPSRITHGVDTWRVSHVYKLVFAPTKETQNIKKDIHDFFCGNLKTQASLILH